jgi:hypothetical protein
MQKGQASLEFLFLILIVIVYITTTIIPLTNQATNAVYDMDAIAKANNESQKVLNAMERVSTFGTGTKETLTLLLPAKTIFYCYDKNISFQTTLLAKPYPAKCMSGTCTKTFTLPSSITAYCSEETIKGPVKATVIIEKKADGKIGFTQG